MIRIDTSKFTNEDFILDKKRGDLILTKFLRDIAKNSKRNQFQIALDLIGMLKIEFDSMKQLLTETGVYSEYRKMKIDKVPQLEILLENLDLFDMTWKQIPVIFGDGQY